MKLTIIVSDKCVYVDGKSWTGLDLSTIDANIHALQWDGKAGWIEYNDGTVNKDIDVLPPWALYCVDQWKQLEDAQVEHTFVDVSDQLNEIYNSYPIANSKAITKILSTQFRNLILAPRIRQSDGNVIGVQVQTVAGEQTGTGTIGLLSIIDATDLAVSLGVPLISDALLPEDKRSAFKDYLINYGHYALEANGTLYLYYPWSLAMAKARKKYIITQERDEKLALGFSFNGHLWDASTESRTNLSNKLFSITNGLDTANSVVWRTKDNVNVTLTVEEFKEFALAMTNYVEQTYMDSWTKKEAVDSSSTYEEVEAV